MDQVVCNRKQSISVGKELKGLKIRDSFLNRKFISFEAPAELKTALYVISAAICHQTYSLKHPELNLYGWDYMEYGFLKMVSEKPSILSSEYINTRKSEELENILKQYFSPTGKSNDCTLDRVPERVGFIKEIGKIVESRFNNSFLEMLHSTNHHLEGENGIYNMLSALESFSDPEKKKISFLVKLLTDAALFKVKDPENFIPIMDYHMQRVLLRTGCVEVFDKPLKKKLISRETITSDATIRKACIESMYIISAHSGIPIPFLNDIFWPLGRSCCNEHLLCVSEICEKQPCTFYLIADIDVHDHCIFETVCPAVENPVQRSYWQPMVDTHFY